MENVLACRIDNCARMCRPPFGVACQVATHLQLNTLMIPFTTKTDEIVEQRLQAKACEYVGSVVIVILLADKRTVLELV